MKEIIEKINDFKEERGWAPDEKGLAISISLEANELLENFQWRCIYISVAVSRENGSRFRRGSI
jgi:hypothetical protein